MDEVRRRFAVLGKDHMSDLHTSPCASSKVGVIAQSCNGAATTQDIRERNYKHNANGGGVDEEDEPQGFGVAAGVLNDRTCITSVAGIARWFLEAVGRARAAGVAGLLSMLVLARMTATRSPDSHSQGSTRCIQHQDRHHRTHHRQGERICCRTAHIRFANSDPRSGKASIRSGPENPLSRRDTARYSQSQLSRQLAARVDARPEWHSHSKAQLVHGRCQPK